MNAHLDVERTTYLVYGLLEADEKTQVRAHLSDCPKCADAVRRLEEERSLIVEATAPAPAREELIRSIAAQVYDRVVSIRRARARRVWVFAAAAGLFLAAGVAFLARTREIAETRSAVAVGRVSVDRGGAWLAQADGYVPTPGDRIRTDDPAGASIRLEEGSVFNISRGSMVEFRGNRGPTAVLRLLEGQVNCQVVPDPRPFTVEAAGTTVTVVGTEFTVHVLDAQPFFKSDKNMLRPPKVGMLVTSGAVIFKGRDGGQLRVPAGWVALSGIQGPPWLWGEIKDLSKDSALDRLLRKTRSVRPAAAVGPIDGAWKDRTDTAVQASVDAVPWERFAHALVWRHREVDGAVRDQRPIQPPDSEVKTYLELGWGTIGKLAQELNLAGDFMQACRNRLASHRFVNAVAEAMSGSPLTEEQRGRLKFSEALDNLLPVFDPATPTLERWKARSERTLAFVRQLKDVLPEEQFGRVTRNAGPSFLIDPYHVWLVEGETAEQAADRLARIWMEQFKLPTYVEVQLTAIAVKHVKAHRDAIHKHRRPDQPATAVEELELFARLCDLQVQAERSVADIPSLNGEARARAAVGSTSLLQFRIGE